MVLEEALAQVKSLFKIGCVGHITRPQTTFLEFQLRERATWRPVASYKFHYVQKVAFSHLGGTFRSIAVVRDHPLLIECVEPRREIYFSRCPDDAQSLLAALRVLVDAAFEGWRSLDNFLNPCFRQPETLARVCSGQLFSGPAFLVDRAARVAQDHGMRLRVFDGGRWPWRAAFRPRALLLDRMFVLAKDFRVESVEIAC